MLAALLSALGVPACALSDTVAFIRAGDGGLPGEAGAVPEAAPAPGRDAACARPEPQGLCESSARAFPFGICACEDFVASAPVSVEAFDSGDPARPGNAVGRFGVNGALNGSLPLDVEGDLTVAGSGGITAIGMGNLTVGGALASAGVLSIASGVIVGGDASVGGPVSAGALSVGGTLTTPEGVAVDVAGDFSAGATRTAPVQVAPPCDCEPGGQFDVAQAIALRRDDNDDAVLGLSAFDLDGFDAPRTLVLPCGQYHFSRVAGSSLTLDVRGPVRFFVDAEMALDGSLDVRLTEEASFDLYVEDTLRIDGPVQVGEPGRAGRVRLFIGGAGVSLFGSDTRISASVYAPAAEIVTQATFDVFGALFGRRFQFAGSVVVHHDAASLDGPAGCR